MYGGVVVVYGYFSLFWSGLYSTAHPCFGAIILSMAVLLAMGLDRLEYWADERNLPWQTHVLLKAARLALIGAASLSDGLGLLCQYCLVVLFAFFSFFFVSGSRLGLTGLPWTLYLVARVRVAEGIARGDIWVGDEQSTTFWIIMFLSLAFVYSIAYLVKREQANRLRVEKLLRELKSSHLQLQDYATQVAELATIEERNRLARDIHDSLGHYMTVINVQLEKAIAFRDRDSQGADQAVKDAKQLARTALQDIRRSVATLRDTPEPFSLSQALTELTDNMSHAQFSIDLEIQGDERDFSPQALMTLYRATQEGLTNVQKHAQANQATVRLRLETQKASLCISDNGQGFDPATLDEARGRPHYGLQGIRERLELIRGSLELESAPGKGTTLFITVPRNLLALVGGQAGRG
jgi:signal transduction histidine kinase